MYLLYSAFLTVLAVLTLPYWLIQSTWQGKYRAGISERLGKLPRRLRPNSPDQKCIWVHAVSVGELLAVSGLIEGLKRKLGSQSWRIVVSTTTMTSQTLAREKFGEENVFYLPLDWGFALKPYFKLLQPQMLVLAETEFWPNLLRLCDRNNVRVAVVNGRVSDRSFPRYKRFRWLMVRVLRNVDLFLAQSETDATRLRVIGAFPNRIQVIGNLKFDSVPNGGSGLTEQLKRCSAAAPMLVFGSTTSGEEEMILPAFAHILAVNPKLLIILAPRHPERFEAVAQLLTKSGLPFVKRSDWDQEGIPGRVFLLDSIGELASCYAIADAAFVGGSLVPLGGHNILEPAQFGKPIFIGPHTGNFREIVELFKLENAVHVMDATHIAEEVTSMTDKKWLPMGERAQKVFEANAGAMKRTMDALETLLWMPSTLKDRFARGVE